MLNIRQWYHASLSIGIYYPWEDVNNLKIEPSFPVVD
jgi:hypothetical protein